MVTHKGLPLKMRKAWDVNGNRVVIVSVPRSRGFSIQTNGNLPNTHRRATIDELEVAEWVRNYGTLRQKEVFNTP